jgi:hypothetical protein
VVPHEIKGRTLVLPAAAEGHRIVIMTGGALRHRRFALRLQKEFGESVVAWYQFGAPASEGPRARVMNVLRSVSRAARRGKGMDRLFQPLRSLSSAWRMRRYYQRYPAAELELLQAEVRSLECFARVQPIPVTPSSLRDPAWIEQLKGHRGYFLLTLGGPLYPLSVLRCFSGACINQHAGHSPHYRGNYTTEWAAFHRQFDRMSVTVHLTVPQADAGPILRRSEPCLSPGDSVAHAFCRVVVLGTELMVEVVREAMATGCLRVFDQPDVGREFLSADFCPEVALAVSDDFHRGVHEWYFARMRLY